MKKQSKQDSAGKDPQGSFALFEAGIEDRDLRIEIFSLCEGAIDQNGRLSVLGGFETVGASSIPFTIPQISVALRLRFWPAEPSQHSVRLVVTNPDGCPVSQCLDAQAALPSGNRDRSQAYNLIVQIQNLLIEAPGEYTVDFYLNERIEGRLPFCVFSESR